MKNAKSVNSIFLLIIILSVLLSGCTKKASSVSNGTYEMQGSSDEIKQPSITFDAEKKTFIFSYDLLSSYLPMGSWELDGKKLVAKTDNDRYTYVFEVLDNETIRFVQGESSHIDMVQGDFPVKDRAEFKYTGYQDK